MGIFPVMEYSYPFTRLRVQGIDSGRPTSAFPYMLVISILDKSLRITKVCCFQIHFVIFYRSIQRAAIMLQKIPSINAKISKKSRFANTYKNYIVCEDYCIAHRDDRTCFLPVSIYHFIVHGEIEVLLHKLETFCFTYQHVGCLYTLLKNRFSGQLHAKKRNLLDNVQRAISLNQRDKGVDKIPSIEYKRGF